MTGAAASSNQPDLWQVRFEAALPLIDAFEPLLDDALSVSKMRVGDDSDVWSLEALYDYQPLASAFDPALAIAAAALNIAPPPIDIAKLKQRDWLAENQAALKVVRIGRFQIVPDHRAAVTPPSHLHRIVLDAGPAFGSGTHETTQSCLHLMAAVALRRRPRRILDLGTGSGILAIGAVRLWQRPVVATDLDPLAVATMLENARANGCGPFIDGRTGSGVQPVARAGRFDLVIANILARPLSRMAADIAGVVAPGGDLILSGILSGQENMVLAPYRQAGFRLRRRLIKGPWASYLLRRRC